MCIQHAGCWLLLLLPLLLLLQVYISVNEEGTEAAAVTLVCELMCGVMHAKPPPKIV
jgi:hypothetical protein